jgi:hypothetical protein
LYKDWSVVLSCLTGNEAYYGEPHINITEIYASIGGTITDNLEAKVSGKFFKDDVKARRPYPWYPDLSPFIVNTITFQALLRYHFHEKFTTGVRFSYLKEDEKGMIFDRYIDDYPYDYDYPYYSLPGSNSGIDLGIVFEYKPKPFMYLRLEAGMLSLSNSENAEGLKIFYKGGDQLYQSDNYSSTRLSAALSMGFRLGSL